MPWDLLTTVATLVNPFRQRDRSTSIRCVVIRFSVADGLAKRDTLIVDTSRTSVIGAGHIDLRTEKLHLAFKPIPKRGVGIKGLVKLHVDVGHLLWKTFIVGGTLAKPALVFDVGRAVRATLETLAKSEIFGPMGLFTRVELDTKRHRNRCVAAIEAAKHQRETP